MTILNRALTSMPRRVRLLYKVQAKKECIDGVDRYTLLARFLDFIVHAIIISNISDPSTGSWSDTKYRSMHYRTLREDLHVVYWVTSPAAGHDWKASKLDRQNKGMRFIDILCASQLPSCPLYCGRLILVELISWLGHFDGYRCILAPWSGSI